MGEAECPLLHLQVFLVSFLGFFSPLITTLGRFPNGRTGKRKSNMLLAWLGEAYPSTQVVCGMWFHMSQVTKIAVRLERLGGADRLSIVIVT